MGIVTRLLSRRRLVIMIGLLLLILLTWIVGWWLLGLSATISVVITLAILVLWIVLLMVERIVSERGANQLEQSIKAQSEDHVMGLRPEKREEVELLRTQLTGAIESLKKSKLGKGQHGKAALYALPWYMMIGPPAAGKTTAIRNSGLEFPYGADSEVQGVGGTRNCDWWFTSSAILLDTAGRYMTEDDDKEEWLAFLDILKKHRRRQPINGVIVAVSMADLVNASPNEVDLHAKNIRKRIDELIQRLGVRFPVYLVFTKCDLLSGFVEFFEDLSRVQRHQVWGCTFSADHLQKGNPRTAFEQEFLLLYQTLLQLRLGRLGPGMKRENRRLVFAFPLQVLAAKENLSQFVGKVFQPNPYQETPIFRGFYLTSGTQEGVPIDRVIQSIASGFGLPPEVTERFNPEITPKTYFIKDLFMDIIIPDERLVRLTSRAERSKRAARMGTLAAAAVVLALFLLAVTRGYIASRSGLADVAHEVSRFDGVPDSTRATQASNLLLARIHRLADPPFFTFGMDRSGAVLDPVRALFYKETGPFIRRSILAVLEGRLRRAESQGGNVYDDLKAYVLLTSDVERLRENKEHQKFITEKMGTLLTPQAAAGMRAALQFFVEDFVQAIEESLAAPFPADKGVLAVARAVAGTPNVPNIYERLKSRITDLQGVALMDRALRSTYAVPGAFTKPGAEAMEKLIEGELTDPGAEAEWVLGIRDQKLLTTESERERMVTAIREMYFRDYGSEWWKLLGSLQVEPYGDLASAAERMKRLGDPNESPLLSLCKQVVDQTRFESGLVAVAAENVAPLGVKLTSRHPVDARFEGFHQFVEGPPDRKTASDLLVLLADLSKLGDELEELKEGATKNAKAYAERLMKGESSGLGDALRNTRQVLKVRDASTRESMSGLLVPALLQIGRTLLATAQAYLNEVWRSEVVNAYQQLLAGSYPFDLRSSKDASLGDMAQFFSAGGKLGSFLEFELRPFLAGGGNWETRQWEGMGIEISSSAREALRSAEFLTKALFKGNVVGMNIEVRIEPPIVSAEAPDFDRVCLAIGGQETCHEWKKEQSLTTRFEWPGAQGMRGATIRLINERLLLPEILVDSMVAEGDWGLFRLLARAERLQQGSRAEYRFRWMFKTGIVIPCLFKAETSQYNPFSPRALTARFPERLN